jgi:hypothetical protein
MQTDCGTKFVMLLGRQGSWNQYGGAVETIKPFNIRNKSFGKAGEKKSHRLKITNFWMIKL